MKFHPFQIFIFVVLDLIVMAGLVYWFVFREPMQQEKTQTPTEQQEVADDASDSDNPSTHSLKKLKKKLKRAYKAYTQEQPMTPKTTLAELAPFIKGATEDKTATLDTTPTSDQPTECAKHQCLRLQEGPLLLLSDDAFNGQKASDAIRIVVDPDGKATGQQDAIVLNLHFDGQVSTAGCGLGTDPKWWQGHWCYKAK